MLPIIPFSSIAWTSRGVRSAVSQRCASRRSSSRSIGHRRSEAVVRFQLAVQSASLKALTLVV